MALTDHVGERNFGWGSASPLVAFWTSVRDFVSAFCLALAMVKQVAPPAWHPRKVSVPPPPWHPTSGSRTTGRLPKTLTRSWQPRVSCAISPRSNCPPPAWLPRSSPAPSRVLGVSVPTPLETAPPRLCRVLAGAAPVSRPLVCSPGVVKPCIPRCLKLHLLEQKKLRCSGRAKLLLI